MNDFDFFSVCASSNSIKALMKLPNVKRENIQSRVYYGGKFPRTFYKTTLAFFDVMEVGHYSARKLADEFIDKILGNKPENVILSVSFQPVD